MTYGDLSRTRVARANSASVITSTGPCVEAPGAPYHDVHLPVHALALAPNPAHKQGGTVHTQMRMQRYVPFNSTRTMYACVSLHCLCTNKHNRDRDRDLDRRRYHIHFTLLSC
jgi:hypothetical protein